jgi:predicted O-methyltransferase YrrM
MQVSDFSYQVLDLLTRYQAPAILMAAHEVGVLAQLGAGPATLDDLAERLGVPRRSLGILLRACVALELVRQEGNCYRCSPLAAATLVPGSPGYLGRLVDKEAFFYRAWARLADCVRTDRAALTPFQVRAREDPETARNFLLGLDDVAALFGSAFGRQLDLEGCRRLLDVGGGVGSYSLALLERCPQLEATILELPAVVPWAREFVAQAGAMERVAIEPFDFLDDPLPRGYDVVLLSNILHDQPPAVNQGLLTRAYQALEPGGRAVVYEFLLDADRVTPSTSAIFAVMMLVENQGGNVYTEDDILGWLAAAGFSGLSVQRLPEPSPMGIVIGHR